jgi:hypothetical protein
MTERFGGDMLYNTFSNTAAITAIVGTSIYEDLKVPADDSSTETLNFYKTSPFSGGAEIFEARFSADCRSADYNTSQELAYQVFTALNRVFKTYTNKYFMVCDILTTIEPVSLTDVYNTPVQVYIRRK